MPGGNSAAAGGKTGVRIVVVGDHGTGKSSLIAAAATESVPENLSPVLPPTRLPADFFPDRVPITIIDTSASLESRGKLNEELKRADVIILTYACDFPLTLTRLSSFWLQEFRRLEVKVPVIVVGCKVDLRDENQPISLEPVMGPIMQQYREIETCIECSAVTLMQVPDVFYYAQKAVLHPTAPLFDQDTQALQPRCIRALRRIFILCDSDMDGALNDEELNDFQVKCFDAPLQPAEIVGVRRVVQEKKKEGVNDRGLTLEGFLFLHSLFIDKGRLETTWAVLRKFGYGNDLKLRDDFLPAPSKHAPDQSVELTIEAVEFVRRVFRLFDTDNSGALRPTELDELFSTAPENPWGEAPYKDAAERTTQGNLTLKGFLSEWALMTMLDPRGSLANLLYIGYGGNPASALHVTRRRSVDRKKQQTERNVFHCLVFGPKNAGKSTLLNSFLGRPFSESHELIAGECYAVNVVDQLGLSLQGNKKTLILQEIPEDGVKKFLSDKESLSSSDVAVFVYDSSDEYSWKRSNELLVEVARHGEESGYGVPSLIIAAKDDLDPHPMSVQKSVCQELGVGASIPISSKLGDMNNVFCRILSAAEHPHLNIPETVAGRKRKQFHQLVNHSLLFMSVGAAFAVAGRAAFRAYSGRRNSPS
ncbi:PREDICTED: mitochondrial Rho GTPase 1 isoform X2 [Populus euphratica]|uniref:Mitochondrial Rho GTPase n=1 Tax=Populus euphratica TaxID=75702 RepID=A0AAJ6UMH7_POPEU|nr:PREDICTED: mitochondrial Rho GTPase 1 isoform X2 [Populus euphratica]